MTADAGPMNVNLTMVFVPVDSDVLAASAMAPLGPVNENAVTGLAGSVTTASNVTNPGFYDVLGRRYYIGVKAQF